MVAKVQSQRGRCEVMDKRKECKEVPWGREACLQLHDLQKPSCSYGSSVHG